MEFHRSSWRRSSFITMAPRGSSFEKLASRTCVKLDGSIEMVELQSFSEEKDVEWEFTFGKALAILSLQLGFMSDVFIIIATSTLGKGLNVNYAAIPTAMFLCSAVSSPQLSRLSDIFGRRSLLLAGNFAGIVGSTIAAFANFQSQYLLMAAGGLLGIAMAQHQLAWAALGEIVPKHHRALALGIFQASLFPAAGFGPVIAQKILTSSRWGNVYWIPLGLQVIALIFVFFCYRPINQRIMEEGRTTFQQIKSLDYVGLLVSGGALLAFLLGIALGGQVFSWKSTGLIAMIVAGFVVLVAVGFYEAFVKLTYPVFPGAIFKNLRGFTVLAIGILFLGVNSYSTSIVWPPQVIAIYTNDPISYGWYVGTMGFAECFAALVTGFFFRGSADHARVLLTGIAASLTTFSALQALVNPTSALFSTVMVAGVGACFSAAVIITIAMIQLSVPHKYIGVATSMVVTARSMSAIIGTTIYTQILQKRLIYYLPSDVGIPMVKAQVPLAEIPLIIEALLVGNKGLLANIPVEFVTLAEQGIKVAYSHAFRIVYLITIAFGVMGTIFVVFSKNVDDKMTEQVDVKLYEGVHLKGCDKT